MRKAILLVHFLILMAMEVEKVQELMEKLSMPKFNFSFQQCQAIDKAQNKARKNVTGDKLHQRSTTNWIQTDQVTI